MTYAVLRSPRSREAIVAKAFPDVHPLVDDENCYRVLAVVDGEATSLPFEDMDGFFVFDGFPTLGDCYEWILEDSDDSLSEMPS